MVKDLVSYFKQYPCTDNTKCDPVTVTLVPGKYFVELWGARSGKDYYSKTTAKGAYVSGYLELWQERTFQIHFGGVGTDGKSSKSEGGNNGGGFGRTNGCAGGGATDMRLDDSLQSRIIVAAGAGGGERSMTGHGGGLNGLIGQSSQCGSSRYFLDISSQPGNQTHGGIGGYKEGYGSADSGGFGYGGNTLKSENGGGGGGGGYFGGGATPCVCSASGGSSYISGYKGCWSVINSSSIITKDDPFHYSGLYFTEGKMIEGNQIMPLPGLSYTEGIGNDGPGAIRISPVSNSLYTCKCNVIYISFKLLSPKLLVCIYSN